MAPQDRITSLARISCSPPAGGPDADAAGALEEQRLHLRLGHERKVLAHARAWIEVADRGRDAPFVDIGDGQREIAFLEFSVLIRQVLEACASRASAAAFACSVHRSGKMRRTGMRPSLPC